jgi:hypothetical protein
MGVSCGPFLSPNRPNRAAPLLGSRELGGVYIGRLLWLKRSEHEKTLSTFAELGHMSEFKESGIWGLGAPGVCNSSYCDVGVREFRAEVRCENGK